MKTEQIKDCYSALYDPWGYELCCHSRNWEVVAMHSEQHGERL